MAETMKKALLEQVNEAITAVLMGGQSYRIGSRSLTRGDLSELMSLRDKLTAEEESGSSDPQLLERTYVAFFDGR